MKINQDRIIGGLFAVTYFLFALSLNWSSIISNELMINGDGIMAFTSKIFLYKSFSTGELPLWNGFVVTGTPLFADPNTSFFYPFHVLSSFLPPTLFTNIYYVFHIGLAGFFTYLFLKENKFNRWIAFLGGIMFSISPIIGGFRREHVMVYTSIVWFPGILYFVQRFINTGKKKNLVFSASAMAMQLFGGHPQWAFYTDLITFSYFIYYLLFMKYSIKSIFKSMFIWIGTYLLFAAVFLIPAFETFFQSSRGTANYFCFLSTNWRLLFTTFFPYIFGDAFTPFGEFASAGIPFELYIGIIPLIYALYATRYYWNNKLVKFSVIAIVLTFLFSMGCNLPLLGKIMPRIPIINLFGVQSRVLFIYVFFGIVCSMFGIADLQNSEHIQRLVNHSFLMLLGLVMIPLILKFADWNPPSVRDVLLPAISFQNPFTISILIASLNLILVSTLFLIRKNDSLLPLTEMVVIVCLLIATVIDVGRLSKVHSVADYDQLIKTEEVTILGRLLEDESYRILPIYDQIYGGDYYLSGLVDNWSMLNGIRNIKGWTEFENPSLNKLLDQVESRDNHNGRTLISEHNDILSMLSVKYILLPAGEEGPKDVPSLPEAEVLKVEDLVTIAGDGTLFVDSRPVELSENRFYSVEFDMNAPTTDVELFYVDFYGGPDYDQQPQQQNFLVKQGNQHYKGILYSGKINAPASEIFFRIVTISSSPLAISNLKLTMLVPAANSANYDLVTQTSRYAIYENTQAQKLLYIPEQVKAVGDYNNLLVEPDLFPDMDRISYVEGTGNYSTGGDLEILNIKNNSLSARVNSQSATFVNHAQSYYPGWKAYIDGKSTTIYKVNGLIQGIEAPPGEHLIEFIYDPLTLKIGSAITLGSLVVIIGYFAFKKGPKKIQPQHTES